MSPSSERGTGGSEIRTQGVHGKKKLQCRKFNLENSRMSPSSERGTGGSEIRTQGVHEKKKLQCRKFKDVS